MPTVLLGNTAVVVPAGGAQGTVNSEPLRVHPLPELGQQITTVSPPPDAPLAVQVQGVVDAWRAHSAAAPAWVEGDEATLVEAVASSLGCPVGCPDNGDPDKHNHETWVEG